MKKGLILEGGAMRGMFTAGVLDVFMENGVEYDGAIGVSAGAAFGCNIKSRQIGRVIRYNKKYASDPRYCSIRSLIKTGDLYGAEFCYHEIPEKLDIFDVEAYDANTMDFYVVCTDVETGKAVYINCPKADHTMLEYVRASASMPFVSKAVEIEGQKLLDGGIADSIPLEFFESIGYDRNIVVLTQPLGFVKKKLPAAPLMKLLLHKYPAIVPVLANRHNDYNNATRLIREKELNGEIIVIRPPAPLDIGKTEHDPDVLRRVYDCGREEAEKHLSEIKAFLANQPSKI